MRPWAGRPNKALSLREIQSEQKAQKAQEDEDKNDVALQAALKASVADTYPSPKTPVAPPRACLVCTYENDKMESLVCEMCGTELPPISDSKMCSADMSSVDATADRTSRSSVASCVPEGIVSCEDEDIQLARALQEEEDHLIAKATAKRAARDSNARIQVEGTLAQRRDPNWRHRHESVSILHRDYGISDDACHGDDEYNHDGEEDGRYDDHRSRTGWRAGDANSLDPRAHGVEYLVLENGTIITKHDPELAARQNVLDAARHLSCMGDISNLSTPHLSSSSSVELKLPNTAYNALKKGIKRADGNVKKGVAQKGRMEKEERATREGVLDDGTRRLILRLINRGALDEVTGAVKTGKESRIYHALGNTQVLRNLRRQMAHHFKRPMATSKSAEDGSSTNVTSEDRVELASSQSLEDDYGDECRVVALEVLEELLHAVTSMAHTVERGTVDTCDTNNTDEYIFMSSPTLGKVKRRNQHKKSKEGAPLLPMTVVESDTEIVPGKEAVAIKVYFTSLNTFSNRVAYIEGDPRYRKFDFKKTGDVEGRSARSCLEKIGSRRLIQLWADKEFRNLCRAKKAGIPVMN